MLSGLSSLTNICIVRKGINNNYSTSVPTMIKTRNYLTSWPHDDQEWFVDIRRKSILQTNVHNPYVKFVPRDTLLMLTWWDTNVRSRDFVLAVRWFFVCNGLCAPNCGEITHI